VGPSNLIAMLVVMLRPAMDDPADGHPPSQRMQSAPLPRVFPQPFEKRERFSSPAHESVEGGLAQASPILPLDGPTIWLKGVQRGIVIRQDRADSIKIKLFDVA